MKKHGSLNHIYRLVWSQVLKTWVAVAENTKGRGKGKNSRSKLVAAALSLAGVAGVLPPALAGPAIALAPISAALPATTTLPSGYQVTAGSASISQAGNTLTVQENSQRAAINWQTFSIGSNGTVNFVQPNSSAVVLNRVVGNETSVIAGALHANGQVFLLNSNGMLFTRGALVNTGGIVASTLSMSDSDFMAGHTTFTSNGSHASVINQGTITAADGGYVALLGNQVINQGVITARLGTAILAAGDQISLNLNGTSLVNVVINKGTLDALVSNQQAIYADGGLVVLTAKGADTILASAVNNTGEIRAQTIANQSGKIYLLGDMQNGRVNVGGALDASAPDTGNGGYIETSAAHVAMGSGAKITTVSTSGLTGSWLIDPNDFTIAASGGDITGTALNAALASNSVTIATTSGVASCTGVSCAAGTSGVGNINVNDTTNPITWSSHTLTLSAYNNININAAMFGSGTAGLSLLYGQGAANGVINSVAATYNISAPVNLAAAGSFSTKLGTGGTLKNYTIITSAGASGDQSASGNNTLQGMAYSGNLSANYALGANISTSTAGWNFPGGFAPIGNSGTPFSATFDGLGHSISTITANMQFPIGSYIGLFGAIGVNGVVQNFTLTSAAGGLTYIGGLAGANAGIINNVGVTSVLSSDYTAGAADYIGGLVGYNSGMITNSQSSTSASVTGAEIGGLVGYNAGTIKGSSSSGVVGGAAGAYLGGLVGYNTGTITTSASSVILGGAGGLPWTGGLVGYNTGTISGSTATGNVNGSTNVGGLVGYSTVSIANSSATGNVVGGDNTGGLIGSTTASVSGSFATGDVSGGNNTGGLVGLITGTVSTSHATGNVTGSGNVGGLIGSGTTGISTSYAAGNVIGSGTDVGGLIGNSTGTIDTSSATGAVSGNGNTGGLVGLTNSTVSNSTAAGNVTSAGDDIGGLIGSTTASVSTSHAINDVSGGNYIGGLVGLTTSSIAGSYHTGNVMAATGYVGGLVGAGSTAIDASSASGNVVAGGSDYLGRSYAGGLIGYNTGTINTSTATGSVTGSGNFVGGLAGSNTGGTITASSTTGSGIVSGYDEIGGLVGSNTGFITTGSATGSVSGHGGVGGLAGTNSGTISTGSASGAVSASGTYGSDTGGLVGTNSGTINSASFSTSNVTSTNSNVGGLAGSNTGTISAASAGGIVIGSSNVGGLVGYNNTAIAIANSQVTGGSVTGVSNVGGLVGVSLTTAAITNSSAAAHVSGTGNNVGGLVGSTNGAISGSSASGVVIGSADYVGGLVGYSTASIDASHATGMNISGVNYIGGLVGKTSGSVSGSNASGAVSGASYVGGLIGCSQSGTISGNNATGNVTASSNSAGGLVGWENGGTISGSFATGTVSGLSKVGGLVGKDSGIITASYATGAVSGSSYVGGLAGYSSYGSLISNSYAQGNVSGSAEVGGLVGYSDSGVLSNAFYNADQVTINGGHELTAGAMFGAQFASWFGSNTNVNLKTVSISNYASSLPLVGGNYQVSSLQGLKDMLGFSESDVTYHFVLTTNLSLPQGFNIPYFSGSFDGGGNTLSNLSISLPDSMRGMFGYLPNNTTTIANLAVANGSVGGLTYVGGLEGYDAGGGAITNSNFSGNVTTGVLSGNRDGYVGGLVGYNNGGTITGSHFGGNVSVGNVGGGSYVGGLVGYANSGGIIDSNAKGTLTTGSVGSSSYVGGLVGANSSANITNSFASVNISVGNIPGYVGYVGGLAGVNWNGIIDQSYATGNVSAVGSVAGGRYAGGLVGYSNGTIQDSYSSGSVTTAGSVSGSSYVGGLIGAAQGNINNSYSTGAVSVGGTVGGSSYVGGLAGANWGATFSNSFYDSTVSPMTGISGTADVAGQVWGMSTADMKNQANFGATGNTANGGVGPNWDFSTPVWIISPLVNAGYPCLAWTTCTPPTVVYLDVASGSSIYGNTPTLTYGYFTTATYGVGSVVTDAGEFGTASWTGSPSAPNATSNVGTYSMVYNSGISLLNNAYVLAAGNSSVWNILTRTVTLSGSKTYDGLNTIAGALLSAGNLVNGDSVLVGGAATLISANAGSENISSLSGLTLNNANYTAVGGSGVVAVGKAPLNVNASNASKTYGQTPTLSAFTSSGLVNGETIASVTEASTGISATASVAGGPYAIVPSAAGGGSFNAGNYIITYANGSLTVTPLAVTIGTVAGATRIYDGTTNAAANLLTITNLINGDSATLSGSATLAGSAVGNEAITGLTGLSLTNPNYTLAGAVPNGVVAITGSPIPPVAASPNLDSVIADAIYHGQAINYLPSFPTATGSSIASGKSGNFVNVVNPLPQISATFGNGAQLAIISSPTGNEPTQVVSLSQARAMLQSASNSSANGGTNSADTSGDASASVDVRVPVSRNSLAEIVNGGVRLPDGVEQQLFVVQGQ